MAAFGLPNFGQLTEAFKKAQQIQQNAQKLQEELDEMEIEGTNENRNASVWLSGSQKPIRIKLSQELIDEGVAATEKGVLEALDSAYEKSTSTMKTRMEELTGGLNLQLPGLNDPS